MEAWGTLLKGGSERICEGGHWGHQQTLSFQVPPVLKPTRPGVVKGFCHFTTRCGWHCVNPMLKKFAVEWQKTLSLCSVAWMLCANPMFKNSARKTHIWGEQIKCCWCCRALYTGAALQLNLGTTQSSLLFCIIYAALQPWKGFVLTGLHMYDSLSLYIGCVV